MLSQVLMCQFPCDRQALHVAISSGIGRFTKQSHHCVLGANAEAQADVADWGSTARTW